MYTCEPTPGIFPVHTTWTLVYGAGTATPIMQTPAKVLNVTSMIPEFAELKIGLVHPSNINKLTFNFNEFKHIKAIGSFHIGTKHGQTKMQNK